MYFKNRRYYFVINVVSILLGLLLILSACDTSQEEAPPAASTYDKTADAQATETPVTETQAAETMPAETESTTTASQQTQYDDDRFYSWIVYWDYDIAVSECKTLSPAMGSISVFSAYFSADDSIIFPENTKSALNAVRAVFGNTKKTYLTFVNDIVYKEGKSSLKNKDLLYRLFSNSQSMNEHIDEIISITKAYGFDGIEIDYEAIKKDDALWQLYAEFLTLLNERACNEGLSLRVILETSALGKAQFPLGPEYTVMCYNLYGLHSGAGPKADADFILETAAKSYSLGQNVYFAFATGGFDWSDSGDVTSLNEEEAIEMAQKVQAEPVRDHDSGALYFTYGGNHTVWFADGQTLCYWMDTAKKAGINHFAMWRLGGNLDESLNMVASYFESDE